MSSESQELVIDRHTCHLLPSAHDAAVRRIAVDDGDAVIGLVLANGERAQLTLVAVRGLRVDAFTTQNVLFRLVATPIAEVPHEVAVHLVLLPPNAKPEDPAFLALKSSDAIYVKSATSCGATIEAVCARVVWTVETE